MTEILAPLEIINACVFNMKVKFTKDIIYVGGGEWRFLSDDPYIVFELNSNLFRYNCCAFVLDVRVSRPGAVGKIYVDYGAGFSENFVVNIDYDHPNSSVIIITDIDRIRGLRWDPDNQAGSGVTIKQLKLSEPSADVIEYLQERLVGSIGQKSAFEILSIISSKTKKGIKNKSIVDNKNLQQINEHFRRASLLNKHKPHNHQIKTDKLFDTIFVIPSINGAHLLEQMIPSLDLPKSSIVVLDQGSTDWTEELCRRLNIELIQLGSPRTYTQACNIGLQLAIDRNIEYLYISNNDIRFVTKVACELLDEMISDDSLAIIAPSQVIVDNPTGKRFLANRVHWDLSNISFTHDLKSLDSNIRRLESDFCELTCALMRVSALKTVGGFDDEYGFYHEDADLCFRLRSSGYNCAYLPYSQIEHYASSTFSANLSDSKANYLINSKKVFARKNLGFAVSHADHKSNDPTSWNIINRNLHPYLMRNGLLDPSRPELIFSHPGVKPFDYLYTVWETDKLPSEWELHSASYKAILNPSRWVCEIFKKSGFQNVHYLPHGVETDIFHPWGSFERDFDGKTYLWFGRNQYRKGLDVMIKAWLRFRIIAPNTRLIIMGHGVLKDYQHYRNDFRQWRGCIVLDLLREGIQFRETIDTMSDLELASIYRSADFFVSTSRSEGFGFSVVEAMACGLTPIFPGYGAGSDMLYEGSFTIEGISTKADYSDKGYGHVGNWWEPSIESVLGQLKESLIISDRDRQQRNQVALRLVRSRFTWRHTCFMLRQILQTSQQQGDVNYNLPTIENHGSKTPLTIAIDHERKAMVSDIDFNRNDKSENNGMNFSEFDSKYYLAVNPDVANAGIDPLDHFLKYGWLENRPLSPDFTVLQLLAANRDLRQKLLLNAGINLEQERLTACNEVQNREPAATKPPLHTSSHITSHNQLKDGVLFIGYIEAGLGLGESLRGLVEAIAAVDTNISIYPFNTLVSDRFIGKFLEDFYDQDNPYKINVFEMATDQLPAALSELGEWRVKRSYNILRTYWELSEANESWKTYLDSIDELWAPTKFIADSFKSIFHKKITIVPPVINIDKSVEPDHNLFGLKNSSFNFMFSFDYFSWTARKNPLAVLQAFTKAFENVQDVGLIIKTVGPKNSNLRVRTEIEAFIKRDPRIVLVDKSVTRHEMIVLLKTCDCYISLHRSEGFGLGMAEAMALSKPVIGTQYGGCTDFLSKETGFPVGYKLRKLLDGEYPFSDNQSWAEPNIDEAVNCMLTVFNDKELRSIRSKNGSKFIKDRFSPDSIGKIAVNRIRDIKKTI